jgi:hypothetical protein
MTYTLEQVEENQEFMQAVTSQAYEIAFENQSGKVTHGQLATICFDNRFLIVGDALVESLEDAAADLMYMNDKMATPILDRLTANESAKSFMECI